MNRGNVPGYYYDEDKKKYFKIQANHLVPQGARYAKENLKKERRSAKKRKVENQRQIRRERETITQASVLNSAAIGGLGLEREHGLSLKAAGHLMQRDRATISQWSPERVDIKHYHAIFGESRLQIAHYIPEREQMVIVLADGRNGTSALFGDSWDWEAVSGRGLAEISPTALGMAAFNSSVSSVSTGTYGQMARVIACADQHQVGNVFMGMLATEFSEPDNMLSPGIVLTLGAPGSSLGDSAIHSMSGNATIIGTCGIFIVDPQANVVNSRPKSSDRTDWPRCEPCINWLDPNTVAYGAKPHHGYSVMLWDVRTPDGRAPRFNVRERLTGVFNPTKYGMHSVSDEHQILTSTNRRIDLFDTRMPNNRMQDTPVLSFPHVHGGPRLQRAANGRLVAAVDADNVVQVYSIQTGTKVGSLATPEWKPKRLESPVLRHLMWYDDIRSGPTLQAVRGNGIVRWVWGGGRDDEE